MDFSLLIGLGFLLILALLAAVTVAAKRGRSDGIPVIAKPLMTERERRVMEMIEGASPGCRVHAQVAMAALVTHHKSVAKDKRTGVRNRFDRKFVDFVIEQKSTGNVLAIVELDDRTHNAAKDSARDTITAAAGYTTVRLLAGEKVTPDLVRE